MPIIPEFERSRQTEQKFKVILHSKFKTRLGHMKQTNKKSDVSD